MLKYWLLSLFIVFSTQAQAQSACAQVHKIKTGVDIVSEINEKYQHLFFDSKPEEQILARSWPVIKSFRIWRLHRQLKHLQKRGTEFDNFDLQAFVFKVDRLAFAHATITDPQLRQHLSPEDARILSDVRRTLLADGISRHFDLPGIQNSRGPLKKFYDTFMNVFSWKYWRWSQALLYMPKLVGTKIPLELAQKIALEGIEPHRAELLKLNPTLRNQSVFNQFSRVYNTLLLGTLLTVVPTMTHLYYEEQIRLGEERAVEMFRPLAETTKQMAETDYRLEQAQGALDSYALAFQEKHGRPPTETELGAAQKRFHEIYFLGGQASGKSE